MFRLPFKLSPQSNFPDLDSLEIFIPANLQNLVAVKMLDPQAAISAARDFAIVGTRFENQRAAEEAAAQMYSKLVRAFAALGIGADFGERRPTFTLSEAGKWLFAGGTPYKADGLIVGLENPQAPPQLLTFNIGVSKGSGVEIFNKVMATDTNSLPISERETIASILFGVASFSSDPEAKLTLLVMAIEALIVQEDRNSDAINLVNEFIIGSQNSARITVEDKHSLLTSLSHLKKESIGQAGRRLVKTLDPIQYDDESAKNFFTKCYEYRSNIAHGNLPRPDIAEIRRLCGPLEIMVGDLIAGSAFLHLKIV